MRVSECMLVSSEVDCLCLRLRSPVGSMTAKEQHLEGQLRFVHSRIITNRCAACHGEVFS